MLEFPLDKEIIRIQEEVAALSSSQAALFSAGCCERLLPVYECFVRLDNWGEPSYLSQQLETVWRFLREGDVTSEELQNQLSVVQDFTPNLEQFDSVVSALALDVCICLDSAIRCCLNDKQVHASEYALRVVRAAACVKISGCLDLGDTPEAERFESSVLEDPYVADELAAQNRVMASLQKSSKLTISTVNELRSDAVESRVDANLFLEGVIN